MSFQCPKCGTQTRDGAKFCHGCGTPIGTATLPSNMPSGEIKTPPMPQPQPPLQATKSADLPPAAPSAPPRNTSGSFGAPTETMNAPSGYQSQMPQTYHPQNVQARPPKKSSGVLKAILITLGVLLLLGTIFIGAAVYMVKDKFQEIAKAAENGSFPVGDGVTINTGKAADKDFEEFIYPNSDRKGFSISAKGKNDKGKFNGGVAMFTTDDDIDEVVDFYKEKFGDKVAVKDTRVDERRTVEMTVNTENGGKKIIVSNDNTNKEKTLIVIAGGGENIPDLPAGEVAPPDGMPPAQAGPGGVYPPPPPPPPPAEAPKVPKAAKR